MWIRFDPLGCREGCRFSLRWLVILCWCHITVNAFVTDAANIPENIATSKNILSKSNNQHECSNITTTPNEYGNNLYTYI